MTGVHCELAGHRRHPHQVGQEPEHVIGDGGDRAAVDHSWRCHVEAVKSVVRHHTVPAADDLQMMAVGVVGTTPEAQFMVRGKLAPSGWGRALRSPHAPRTPMNRLDTF